MQPINPVPICDNDTAMISLIVPDEFYPVGINERCAIFMKGEAQRKYALPFGDRTPCTIKQVRIGNNAGEINFRFIEAVTNGEYITNVSIEGGGGYWWVLIKVSVEESG